MPPAIQMQFSLDHRDTLDPTLVTDHTDWDWGRDPRYLFLRTIKPHLSAAAAVRPVTALSLFDHNLGKTIELGLGVSEKGAVAKDWSDLLKHGFIFPLDVLLHVWDPYVPHFKRMFKFLVTEFGLSRIQILDLGSSSSYDKEDWHEMFSGLNDVHTLALDFMLIMSVTKVLGESPILLPSLRRLILSSVDLWRHGREEGSDFEILSDDEDEDIDDSNIVKDDLLAMLSFRHKLGYPIKELDFRGVHMNRDDCPSQEAVAIFGRLVNNKVPEVQVQILEENLEDDRSTKPLHATFPTDLNASIDMVVIPHVPPFSCAQSD
ncbi:hypothetical protein OF83DRAFT_1178693 [Amylostereum chailletii]|nr:hypothetical protein OF83DRAFT_1178693 [Amylostereum chailletii]